MNYLELKIQLQLQTQDSPYEIMKAWDFGVAGLGNSVGVRVISKVKYRSAPNRTPAVVLQVEKGEMKSLQFFSVGRKLVDNWVPLSLPHLERLVGNAEGAPSTSAGSITPVGSYGSGGPV